MQYLILLKVPSEVAVYVRNLRLEHGFKDRILGPHITVVPPFVTMIAKEDLMRQLSSIKYHKFILTIDGFSFFEGRNNVINLNVVDNTKLTKLYADLKDALEMKAEKAYGSPKLFKSEYVPHVMVEKRIPQAKFRTIQKEFRRMSYDIRWTIDRFCVFGCEDDGKWEEIREFVALDA